MAKAVRKSPPYDFTPNGKPELKRCPTCGAVARCEVCGLQERDCQEFQQPTPHAYKPPF